MKRTLLYIGLVLVLLSCKKPEEDEPEVIIPVVSDTSSTRLKGLFILNEGTWQQNNASLSYFDADMGTVETSMFENHVGRKLGDVANDMLISKGQLYILINNSHTLEKYDIEARTSKQLSIVDFQSTGRSPRHLFLGDDGDLYISSFDGVVSVIDTASLVVKQLYRVGRNPEELVISNNVLFVCNSGGLDFPNYDSTVSVIDLSTQKSIDTLFVGLNVQHIAKDNQGRLFIGTNGNYNDVDPRLFVFDGVSRKQLTAFDYPVGDIQIYGDQIFIQNSSTGAIDKLNEQTLTIEPNFLAPIDVKTLSGFKVDTLLERVYCMDALNYLSSGKVFCYNYQGEKQFQINVGVIPSTLIINHKQ